MAPLQGKVYCSKDNGDEVIRIRLASHTSRSDAIHLVPIELAIKALIVYGGSQYSTCRARCRLIIAPSLTWDD